MSRAIKARIIEGGIERLVRPASTWCDSAPIRIGVMVQSQAMRRAVSAGIGCAHSSSAACEPTALVSVARSTVTIRCGFWPPTCGSRPQSN